jgi:hypothetical protein
VQHPFALVWIKRRQGFLRGPFPGLDFLFIFSEQGFALIELLSRLKPRKDLLGDAKLGNLSPSDLFQDSLGFFISKPAIAIEEAAQSSWQIGRRSLNPKGVGCRIGDDVDHGRVAFLGVIKATAMPDLKVMQSGLNMLAGAQAINAEIYAGAKPEAVAQTADLYGVGHAASRTDSEVCEDRVIACCLGNAERFDPSAEPSLVDLVRIGGSPVVSGGNVNFWVRYWSGFAIHRRSLTRHVKEETLCADCFLPCVHNMDAVIQ